MRTCPACHRSVPDTATICPHSECGKPLAAAAHPAIKRPPPPGPVHMTAQVQNVPAGVVEARRAAWRTFWRWLGYSLGVLLMIGLGGGVWYAAAVLKYAQLDPPKSAPAAERPSAAKIEQPSKSETHEKAEPIAKSEPQVKTEPAMPATLAGAAEPELVASKPAAVDETLAAVKTAPAEPKLLAAELPAKAPGLYAVRTTPDREQLLPQLGGTPESELAVAAGLAWLARHQALDGHWGPDCLGSGADSRCEQDNPCGSPGGVFEGAYTGLAVLAFQAGGHYYFNKHQYSQTVARGLDIMVSNQGLAGELVGSMNRLAENPGETSTYNVRYMYEHAMGTFALAEACATAKAAGQKANKRYLAAAIKAVRFIESQQHDDGGWRYTPKKEDPCDCSVSGWVMLALKTALEAEIKVNPETIYRMVQFFKAHADLHTGRTHYQVGVGGTDALTGVGMMLDQFILHDPHSQLVQLAAPYLAGQAEAEWGGELGTGLSDFYTWYNCTLAMFQAGGNPWNRWNGAVRDHVQKLQIGGAECAGGSWDPTTSRWGSAGGRIYTTALGVLTLEVYYRFARQQAEKQK